MGGCNNVHWHLHTNTHTSCYAAVRSLALPHMRHATLLYALFHFHTYAAVRSLALLHIRHGGDDDDDDDGDGDGDDGDGGGDDHHVDVF